MKSNTSEPVQHRVQSHQESSKGKSQLALVVEFVFRSCPLPCGARAHRLPTKRWLCSSVVGTDTTGMQPREKRERLGVSQRMIRVQVKDASWTRDRALIIISPRRCSRWLEASRHGASEVCRTCHDVYRLTNP
jgi:hypothetical protein